MLSHFQTMSRRRRPPRITFVMLVILSVAGASIVAQIQFQDVSDSAGISHAGQSWGVVWGDFNGDGWPDLWVDNHLAVPSLYLNLGDGTFSDISQEMWSPPDRADTHTSSWADYDNDGDQDLFMLVGGQGGTGSGPNYLLENVNGVFQEQAVLLGLDYPLGRGRGPLWLDYDRDSFLDVLLTNAARADGLAPTALFQQTPEGFINVSDIVGIELTESTHFALLSDLSGDEEPDLVVSGSNFPYRIYDISTVPFLDLTDEIGLPATNLVKDAVIADFTGDLHPDIYLATLNAASEAIQVGESRVEASLAVSHDEIGLNFQTLGDVFFDLRPVRDIPLDNIFIGADGIHPLTTRFMLSATDPDLQGIAPHNAGIDQGVYIGIDPENQVWTVLHSWPFSHNINVLIESTLPVQNVSRIGFGPYQPTRKDAFFVYNNGSFVDETTTSGFNEILSSHSAVAGDFDNDMDLDLYVVCTGPVENRSNHLYENLGDGTFVLVPDAGGAAGTGQGRGDSVAAADYDGDGFLDLFVTNGFGSYPFNYDGPHQLFRNQGNENHWIEIDLNGVASNKDGTGARVLVTAGGVTQLREQNGGMHYRSQNHKRVHFGLGNNTVVKSIYVHWPNGMNQEIRDVSADQILDIIEGPGIGDLNEDLICDILDVNILANFLAGTIEHGQGGFTSALPIADMNDDVMIDAVDLLLLLQKG